jgi:REP element-mobilizing transposase RayT
MRREPYLFDLPRAKKVLTAVQEVCRFRNWDLIAAHVRTNHVHVIVDGLKTPASAITTLKAYSSRALNTQKNWARGGSATALASADAVSAAVEYVVNQQGEPLACAGPDSAAGL